MSKVIGVVNQKGGVGKTTLSLSLGASLARLGHKVCLVDCDPQANLTMALGHQQPDELPVTLPHIMAAIIENGNKVDNLEVLQERKFLHHAHGVDFVPSSIDLADLETTLLSTIARESVLKKFIGTIKNDYDFVILDGPPSLNILTVCLLTAADSVIIPTQPQYFSAKGIELLLRTIAKVRENLNPNLSIMGSMITMFDGRLNFHKEVHKTLTRSYSKYFRVFETKIPLSVRVTESQAKGQSIFDTDPTGKIAQGYDDFAKELLSVA